MSNSLRPHESQHARPPCPSPTPGVHSNSRPSSQWCHPAISSSVVPFSSCPQSLPASESFPVSQFFAWGGQSTGVSALASFRTSICLSISNYAAVAARSLQLCPTLQPIRLHRPWDSPGKNTGVGCCFLLQCMKVKSESEVAQSCPTPSDPMDSYPPGSSVHGIF